MPGAAVERVDGRAEDLRPIASLDSVEAEGWFEKQCEAQLKPTQIRVVALPSEIRYDFTPSMTQLTERGTRQKQLGQVVLGLTEVALRSNAEWGGNYLVDSKTGRACMRPNLKLSFDVNPQRVSVAREFPRGTCAFQEIVKHELRHVEANQAQLERTAQMMQGELTRFFGQKVFYGTSDTLRAQLEQAIRTSWLPLAQADLDRVGAAHNAIDSPAEYGRNRTMCDGAVVTALRKTGLER